MTSLLLWLRFFPVFKIELRRREKWPIIRKRGWALTVDTWHIELTGESKVKQTEAGGRGWVDGYTMLMSPLRVALGRHSCPLLPVLLPGCPGCAHAYCPGCELVYECQLPLRFAIFVLLNSYLECFLSASKIAIFFSVRYATCYKTKDSQTQLNSTCIYTM